MLLAGRTGISEDDESRYARPPAFVSSLMFKILDVGQVKELDQYTIRHEPVASIDLMERACKAFVNWFDLHFGTEERVGVVCGTGNNGGDGLGIARLLSEMGYEVKVWIVRGGNASGDFSTNLSRLPKKIESLDFKQGSSSFAECDVLIDAIFGSGLTRPAEGIYAEAIQALNKADAVRVAVDIPSGLMADRHSEGPIVNADFTVTFQRPKLSFLLPENHLHVGQWHRVDIGLNKSFIRNATTSRYYLTRKSVKKLVKHRDKFSHKGDYGRGLLVSGSLGKMGAAVLASRGALRAGIGLLTVHVPAGANHILQTAVPEAMLSLDSSESMITEVPDTEPYQVIGVGPGIGQSPNTAAALRGLLETGKPMVIDADALNLISSHRELIHLVPKGSILTPHPKEFERLAGRWENDFERLTRQAVLAIQLKSVVLVKGANTAIATPEGDLIFNCTGNPGMATGGTGDVLTGVLTGLLAQGYSCRDAAIIGVYVHGLAGDLAAWEKGQTSLIAGDLADFLPQAFKTLD